MFGRISDGNKKRVELHSNLVKSIFRVEGMSNTSHVTRGSSLEQISLFIDRR